MLVLVSVVSAQQQPKEGLTDSVCNFTATKPTPATKTYVFKTCIVAKFASYLVTEKDKYVEFNNGVVDAGSSSCENSTTNTDPKLVIKFDCGQLEFQMGASNDSKIFVKALAGMYTINNATVVFANSTQQFITTQSGHYYKCNAEQTVPVGQPNAPVDLVLSNFAYEVFRSAKGTDFYKVPEECPLDSGADSDLVRIGVGICLVALVAIVLVAYFVGRRRWSERSSYESV